MSAVLLYENAVWFHSGCPESVRRVSLRSSLFRFLSGSRARHGTEVTKKKKKKTLPPFLTFCSRPMPSRDIPFRYEETEKTATQANDVYDLAWVNSTGIILSIVRHLGQRELCRQKTAFPAAFLAESLKTNGTD